MTQPLRIAIVGGGAIGLSIAWELSGKGDQVTVFDSGNFDDNTTSAASGILPPANLSTSTDAIDRLRGLSHERFPRWAEKLMTQTGIDIGLRRCGGWYLADGAGEAASLIGMRSYWDEMNIDSNLSDIANVKRREPALTGPLMDEMQHAVWTPDEYRIEPKAYQRALRKACESSGVTLRSQTRVKQVSESQNDLHSGVEVQCGGGKSEYDRVVLCAGAQLGAIARSFRLHQSVIPIRGQVIRFQLAPKTLHSVINVGNRYLINRDDGSIVVGSCEEEAGFNCQTTPEMLESLRDFAFSLIPGIAHAKEIESWAGLRPMTFDGFPMIGKVPRTRHTFVAGGHYRSGIHLSPGTAEVLSDLIHDIDPEIDLSDFSIAKQQSA